MRELVSLGMVLCLYAPSTAFGELWQEVGKKIWRAFLSFYMSRELVFWILTSFQAPTYSG